MRILKILFSVIVFVCIYSAACLSNDTSKYMPTELKGVYIGMSLEQFKTIRAGAVEERSFGNKMFFEKSIGNKYFESAVYEFDKQLHLKCIRLGNLFRAANKNEVKNNVNEHIRYSVLIWGKKFEKKIWKSTILDKTFEVPCLYWKKNNINILMDISFYSKEQSPVAPTGCHICIFDASLAFENVNIYGIQDSTPIGKIESIFSSIPELDKVVKDTVYIESSVETIEKPVENKEYPVFSQDIREYDLGKVSQNEKRKIDINFKNTGNGPLEIFNVEADCFCTAAIVENKIIKKNESGKISIEFNPKGKKGKQKSSIAVFTNDKKNSQVMFTITVEVKE